MQLAEQGWTPKAFGGGLAESRLTPVMGAALLICGIGVLTLPRKYALGVLLLGSFLIPPWAVVVLGGVHFPSGRVFSIVGLVRLLFRGNQPGRPLLAGGINKLDMLVVAWASCRAVAFVLLWHTGGAIVNQSGFLVSVIGMYLLLRHLIRDAEDFTTIARVYVAVAVIDASEMLYEQLHRINLFAMLSGAAISSEVRLGRVRSQGSFAHPLLAGAWAATAIPIFVFLWRSKKKVSALVGLLSATIMAWATATSTPLLAFLGGAGAICMWPMRTHMRRVRWGIVIALVAAQCVMKAPVWFLIGHIDLTGGSSGYHRAMLVDQFIRRVGDWWLLGTQDNASWGYEMGDTSNGFIAEGETGGLATFALFIGIISCGFSLVGKAGKAARGRVQIQWNCWLLGSCLFANILALIGVTYWDQTQVSFLALFAMILVASAIKVSPRQKTMPPFLTRGSLGQQPVFCRFSQPRFPQTASSSPTPSKSFK